MVNSPLIRPYFLGGVALGGAARIPLIDVFSTFDNGFLFLSQAQQAGCISRWWFQIVFQFSSLVGEDFQF